MLPARLAHAAELTAAVGVDPQVPRGTAAIALPARGIGGVAADDEGASRPVGEMIDLAPGQQLRQPARDVDRVRAIVAEEGLPVRRHEEDAPVGGPAAHHHVGTEPGHPSRRTPVRGHEIHLGMQLVAADEGEPLAVRRERRRRRLARTRGEPGRHAAFGAHAPEVVVAHEYDVIAAQRGLAQVAWDHGGSRGKDDAPRPREPGAADTDGKRMVAERGGWRGLRRDESR